MGLARGLVPVYTPYTRLTVACVPLSQVSGVWPCLLSLLVYLTDLATIDSSASLCAGAQGPAQGPLRRCKVPGALRSCTPRTIS
jgi:hypothetical protein